MTTVCLVEDEPLVRRFLRRALERMGAAVVDHPTAASAVGYDGPCDLWLVDLLLMDSDGTEVVRRIRARGGEAPVWVVSGAIELEVDAREAGAHRYFDKIHDVSALLSDLQAWVADRS